ncbi:3-oxoacyl-ACP reductase FabG [Aquihabitans sp. G128]|uniref:3-oxoacyl-ACP reductase FabG n=1 Tax=Aquihabitans sp. G128 TaxID=2849779 RepID=UPI001C245335|nr:3-oxoacyl-ACP reductase FabG [Aquihabitans sp. G128]QXC61465.1 3-oxoacyl-ACP reductase FabG [Aquihabitans sp. G128]
MSPVDVPTTPGPRVALVTGASGGIGAATAAALAAGGCAVAVGYRSGQEAAEVVVAEITAAGGTAFAVAIDVTDPGSVDGAFALVEAELGAVAVLVNNAGATADGLFLRMGADQWRTVLATNLDGAFHVTRRATPKMVRARWGRIVNVSSVVGLLGSAGQANYSAAKAGLVGLTRSLARELGSRGITANVVAPGPIATGMLAATGDARTDELAALVPVGRIGQPAEVAAAIAYLCSDAAAYVTGAVLPVDGGLGMGH